MTQEELLASILIFLAISAFCITVVRPKSLEYWVKTGVISLTLALLVHEASNFWERSRWIALLALFGQLIFLAYLVGDARREQRRVIRFSRKQKE